MPLARTDPYDVRVLYVEAGAGLTDRGLDALAVGSAPLGITSADLDGDGLPDLAVSLYCSDIAEFLYLSIDMEMRRLKNITFEVFRRLRCNPEFREYPHLGLAVQVYLRETDQNLDQLIAWARCEGLPISIRLVKGAYWDYETVITAQRNWPAPAYAVKAEADHHAPRQGGVLGLRNGHRYAPSSPPARASLPPHNLCRERSRSSRCRGQGVPPIMAKVGTI